jgi:hypothetical protein
VGNDYLLMTFSTASKSEVNRLRITLLETGEWQGTGFPANVTPSAIVVVAAGIVWQLLRFLLQITLT